MTGIRRLSDHGADDFERSLLDAARSDAGSDRALERALRAYSASAAGAAPSASAVAGAPSASALIKIVIGCTVMGLLVATAMMKRGAEPAVPSARVRQVTVAKQVSPRATESVATESVAGGVAAVAPVPAPTDDADPTGPTEPAPRKAARDPSASASKRATATAAETEAAPKRASLLAAEVRLLQATRSALAAEHPARALALLDQHAREFGSGVLGPEATVLRVQALLASGEVAQGRAVAEQFLARNPTGAHATRIRALLR